LIIRIKAGDDANIGIGTAELVSSGQTFDGCAIVKVAFGRHATRQLSMEASLYYSLSDEPDRCKIARMYGFFVDLTKYDEPQAVLLLQYAGNPLHHSSIAFKLTGEQWCGKYVP